ncbi:uncharacterized protein si:ch211-67e16.11 [Micropterus salmoides]|uniref:uncharacterized protein si:ch211-67e16.11 n=1 Tax=Micropterus salmoides TaxID=27706 RepID=UPI0018EDBD48|nr:uncharacterized protein si:ch211-67e16.11 [Micropterus salmoides]XP_045909097.1 uncharacterized protein si:ch211-67e16.11 [Micropterus dolomieu]
MRLPVLLAAPLSILILHIAPATSAGSVAPSRLERWVRSGLQSLQWDQLDRCLRMSSLSEAECRRLAHLPLSAVAVYVSEPRTAAGNSDKVLAILPDSSGGMVSSKLRGGFSVSQVLNGGEGPPRQQQPFPGSTAHDTILVLDPSPGENFGHPVVLFYVDVNVTKKRCSHMDGIYLGEECLTLALKGRCQNQLKRRQAGSERLVGNGHGRLRSGAITTSGGSRLGERAVGGLCEVHFLPLVVGVGDSNRTQRLRCVDHAEFARCPQPLPMSSPSLPVSSCELNKNTRRCHQQPLATHLSCRLYQTCDHAVLISGGWQQQMTFQRHVQNLQNFHRMLQNNGFHNDHIKTFFASSGQLPEEVEGVYSATEKAVIRNHVSYICRKQHCADTLVLYLNSPTRNDGTMLLWDANLNGIADLKERYSVNELLADLAGCKATRVLLFVDQSYSGVLSKRLRGSQKHLNVVLIQSQTRQTHSHQRLNSGWEDSSWSYISPATCLLDHLGKGPGMSRLLESWAGFLNVTLAGAPCNATPPLTDGEMRREYQGCQNLPTALWHQKHRRTN